MTTIYLSSTYEDLKKPCLTFVETKARRGANFMDSQKAEDKGERINLFRRYLLMEKTASSFPPHMNSRRLFSQPCRNSRKQIRKSMKPISRNGK